MPASTVEPASPAAARPGYEVAYDAALDAMAELLRADARAWAERVRRLVELDDLVSIGAAAGSAQFPQLEMAGSWQVSQITADRWLDQALRLSVALPRTLAMLATGDLLVHQAKVLLHRTKHCSEEVARAVEAEVLPAGAALYPSDLASGSTGRSCGSSPTGRRRLRRSSAMPDAAAESGRTFSRPLLDGWRWPAQC
jgi:hypothetical protein